MTEDRPPTVAVNGTAEREVPPDYFTLGATVTCRGSTTSSAYERLAVRSEALDDAIGRAGPVIERVDRGPLNAWHGGSSKAGSWRASRRVQVRSHTLDAASELAGVLGAIEDAEVFGPHWHLDRDNPAFGELQAEAVHEARARAERYAAAVGAGLGRLVELRDVGLEGGHGGFHTFAMPASAAMHRGGDPGLESLDLAPQPIPVSASVEARWYLDLPQ